MNLRRLGGLAAMLAVLALTGPMLLDAYVNHVTFYPWPGMDVDPSDWPRPVEQVRIQTEDGVSLHGFWLPVEDSRHALLYFHGNAGNASHRLPVATRMAELGVSVLLPDYRGYGLSEGRPDEAGLYADARAALAFLADRGFGEDRVIVFGRSLGGAVAVDLARDRSLAGVVLCSTFSSGSDMAKAIGMGWFAPLVRRRFASIDKIGAVQSPLLFLHGTEDEIVPHGLGRRLHQAADAGARWVDLPGARHNDVTVTTADVFWPALAGFVSEVTSASEG